MKDLEVILKNRPGSLACFGEMLGENHISLEGGGVFSNGDYSIAHFLVRDAEKAREVLTSGGFQVKAINEVIIQKLRQGTPGQLGSFARRLAEAGVNIHAQYSDHSNQLIVVVDNVTKAKAVSKQWMKQ